MNPILYQDFCRVCHQGFKRREKEPDNLFDYIKAEENGVVFGICPNCIEKAANK